MFNSKYCYLVAFFPRTILNDVWKVNQCKASTKPEMFVLKNRYLERMQSDNDWNDAETSI